MNKKIIDKTLNVPIVPAFKVDKKSHDKEGELNRQFIRKSIKVEF